MSLRFRRLPLRRLRGRAMTRTARMARARNFLRFVAGNVPPVVRARNKPLAFRSWGLPFLLRRFDNRNRGA